jgi:OST3 / OST6 family, transporter family
MRQLLQLLLLLIAACSSSTALIKSEAKREILKRLIRDEPFATVGDAKFASVVHEGPRDYEVFVLFTASPSQYRCTACSSAEANFKLAASSYSSARQANTASVLAAREAVFLIGDMPGVHGTVNKLQVSVLLYILRQCAAHHLYLLSSLLCRSCLCRSLSSTALASFNDKTPL